MLTGVPACSCQYVKGEKSNMFLINVFMTLWPIFIALEKFASLKSHSSLYF